MQNVHINNPLLQKNLLLPTQQKMTIFSLLAHKTQQFLKTKDLKIFSLPTTKASKYSVYWTKDPKILNKTNEQILKAEKLELTKV